MRTGVEGRIAAGHHDGERERALRALKGDVRAFRDLYDSCFLLAWACSLRMTGDARVAELVTARALRSTFAALAEFDGTTSLGRWVVVRVEGALRELQAEARPALEAPPEHRNGA